MKGCMIWLVAYGSGQIACIMKKLVRTVCFVAGAGTALPSSVGRLLGTAPPQTTGITTLASARSSSHSQLAAQQLHRMPAQSRFLPASPPEVCQRMRIKKATEMKACS